MNIKREIESSTTVGDYDNGDGAKVWITDLGVMISTGGKNIFGRIEWDVWDVIVSEVERYRRAVAAADQDVAVVPVTVEGRG